MPTKCVCDKNGKVVSIKNNFNAAVPTTPSNRNTNAINLVTIKDAMTLNHNIENECHGAKINNNIVVDLLCIVLSINYKRLQSDTAKYYTSFLITDSSLLANTCAKIHIYNDNNVAKNNISPGDVFRFNSMMIKQNYYDILQEIENDKAFATPVAKRQKALDSSNKNNEMVIICEFVSSWRHPEAGPIYVKVNDDKYNLPLNMMSTPMKQVRNLQKWYEDNHAMYHNEHSLL